MADLVCTALRYAERGWAVFPIRPGTKVPACAHGCKDATTDPAQVGAWWRGMPAAGIGIATGSASRLLVVDVDGDVEEGLAALRARGELPPTLTSRTGSGGLHLVYRMAEGTRLPNSAGKLATRVDTRGEGGYIVAPPTIHPSGRPYAWADESEPAWVPTWVATALTERETMPAYIPPTGPLSPESSDRIVAGILRVLEEAQPGHRNDRLNWAAYTLFSHIAAGRVPTSLLEARDVLRSCAARLGLPADEVRATLLSAAKAAVGEFAC